MYYLNIIILLLFYPISPACVIIFYPISTACFTIFVLLLFLLFIYLFAFSDGTILWKNGRICVRGRSRSKPDAYARALAKLTKFQAEKDGHGRWWELLKTTLSTTDDVAALPLTIGNDAVTIAAGVRVRV